MIRESQNRAAMREKFWELSGTKLGNLLKLNKEADKLENSNAPLADTVMKQDEEEIDYKAES